MTIIDWVQVVMVVVVMSTIIFILIRVRVRQLREQEEAARHSEDLQKAILDGAVPPGKCLVCKERDAMAFFPYVGRSLVEGIIPLRALYHVPPMYVRRADTYAGPLLCRSHGLVIAAKIDAALAEIRQKTAAFTTQIALDVATLEGGMLLEWARQQDRVSIETLQEYRRQAQGASQPPAMSVPGSRLLTTHPEPKEES